MHRQEWAGLINVREKVETRDDLETFSRERSIESLAYKDFRSGGCFRLRRRRGFHLAPVQFPGSAFHHSQECARTTSTFEAGAAPFNACHYLTLPPPPFP